MKKHRFLESILLVLFAEFSICTAQTLNVLFVNEKGNGVLQEVYKSVLKYARDKLSYKIEDTYRAEGNGSDAEAFLDDLCAAYNKSIDAEKPIHLVLDMTRSEVPSETTKSFTKLLGLPTVTASFGQAGDLRQWRNLNDKQKKYLMQVMPPEDLLAEVVRPIVNYQSISNAGILFDKTFVMDHKYKSLLQNVPTRHLINEILNPTKQLKNFNDLDLFNYFILGKVADIKKVLDAGHILNYNTWKYAWHTVTQEAEIPSPNCVNCTFLHVKPFQTDSSRKRMEELKSDYGLNVQPTIDAGFYFDLMLRGIMAAKSLLDKNKYKDWKPIKCEDYKDGMNNDRSSMTLMEAFKEIDDQEPWAYGPFVIIENGKSQMNFTTNIQRINVLDNKIAKNEPVGQWNAGLTTTLSISNATKVKEISAKTEYTIVTLEKPKRVWRMTADYRRQSNMTSQM